MKRCPKCNGEMELQHKDILHPADDIFVCVECEINSYRYQDTELERPGDKRFSYILPNQKEVNHGS